MLGSPLQDGNGAANPRSPRSPSSPRAPLLAGSSPLDAVVVALERHLEEERRERREQVGFLSRAHTQERELLVARAEAMERQFSETREIRETERLLLSESIARLQSDGAAASFEQGVKHEVAICAAVRRGELSAKEHHDAEIRRLESSLEETFSQRACELETEANIAQVQASEATAQAQVAERNSQVLCAKLAAVESNVADAEDREETLVRQHRLETDAAESRELKAKFEARVERVLRERARATHADEVQRLKAEILELQQESEQLSSSSSSSSSMWPPLSQEPRPPPNRMREYGVVGSFEDMDLEENLLRGIIAYGIDRPSLIQQRGILPMVDGRDTICQAPSGTGKTCAFVTGVLQRIDFGVNVCQGLILAPTRELAFQIHSVVLALGQYLRMRAHACIGGTSVSDDIDRLREGQHVIVGMPGRVYDMISTRHLRVDHVFTFVLDEADLMLSGVLMDQVYDIFKRLPSAVPVALFSATMPQKTLELSTRFMRDTVRILECPEALLLEDIRHFFVAVHTEDCKVDRLCELYETLITFQAIVYFKTRRKVDSVAGKLNRRGFTVSALHGELDQAERDLAMREFRAGSSRVLFTTDAFSRGIDVALVRFVISYDMPADPATYLHRVGRCCRFGRLGVAISFISDSDIPTLREVESCYSTQFEELPMDSTDLP